jgi:hypothetical protein
LTDADRGIVVEQSQRSDAKLDEHDCCAGKQKQTRSGRSGNRKRSTSKHIINDDPAKAMASITQSRRSTTLAGAPSRCSKMWSQKWKKLG